MLLAIAIDGCDGFCSLRYPAFAFHIRKRETKCELRFTWQKVVRMEELLRYFFIFLLIESETSARQMVLPIVSDWTDFRPHQART